MTAGEWRDTLAPITKALMRIAVALERFEPVTEPEPEPAGSVCPHPEDARLALGAGAHGWICRSCQHVEKTP